MWSTSLGSLCSLACLVVYTYIHTHTYTYIWTLNPKPRRIPKGASQTGTGPLCEILIYKQRYMVVTISLGRPQSKPLGIIILIMGPPKKVTLILGNFQRDSCQALGPFLVPCDNLGTRLLTIDRDYMSHSLDP